MIVEVPTVQEKSGHGILPRIFLALFVLLFAYIGWNYFFAVQNFPNYHGDESGFLNIPYRWCEYHDTRYPTAWSHSFGSDEGRRYPPPAAFVLRSQYHAAVGFSPLKSRVFSGLLILTVLATAAVFLRRWSGLALWQQLLVLGQVGLAPVMIYTARSTRFEQEILFFGWMGAIALPSLIPMLSSRWAKAALWILSGISLGWGANSHPFGAVFCLVGVWLLFTAKQWHEYDGFRLWQRLGLLGAGFLLLCIPTVLWIAQGWDHFTGYAQMQRDLYAVREGELIDFYAGQPPCARLCRVLPKPVVARLNTLYSASYEDYFSYPVPNYRYRLLLEAWFLIQFALIAAYFGYSLWRRFQNGHAWLHLLVLLSLGFVGFQLWYPPATTYKVYTTFFVTFTGGLVLWQLAQRLSQNGHWRIAAAAIAGCSLTASGFVFHYSVKHLTYVTRTVANGDFPNVTLDQEFAALKEMSHRLKIAGDEQVVYTSVESWIASGKDTHSLWESVMLGLAPIRSDADGVVFKNAHVNFKLTTSGGDQICKFPTRQERIDGLATLVAPMRLSGLILNDFTPEGAYSYYTRCPQDGTILVAHMLRSQETVFKRAAFVADHDGSNTIELASGQYIICAWTNQDPGLARLEFFTQDAATATTTVSCGPLSTIVPVPLFIAVEEESQRIRLGLTGNQSGSRILKCAIYKMAP